MFGNKNGTPVAAFVAEVDSSHEAIFFEKQAQEPSASQPGIEGWDELSLPIYMLKQ